MHSEIASSRQALGQRAPFRRAVAGSLAILVIAGLAAGFVLGQGRRFTPKRTGAIQHVQRLPWLVVTTGTPQFKPTTMYSGLATLPAEALDLDWISWTETSATAIGTLLTPQGCRSGCAPAKWVAHPNHRFTLSDPSVVTFTNCATGMTSKATLFTRSSLFGRTPLPAWIGPCPTHPSLQGDL
jgi:hypothetical protein